MLPRRTPALRGQLLLSTFAIALIAAPAAAQETPAADDGVFQMLGRMIFGAGTAKVAIDTPQAVTALEQADIDQKQPKTLSDLLKGVPGVQTAGASARPLGQAFNIRGIGATEQAASEDRIKVTIDGAPKFFEGYRMGAFFGDLELFKRVEILRGPASSTLYGTGTIGGVIAFTTKDASDFLADGETTALRFKGDYGSNGDSTGAGVILAHRAGNAEFLASLHKSDSGVLKDGAGNDILGTEFDGTSALLKSKFSFGEADDQSVTLSYSRSSADLKNTQVVQTGGSAFFSVFGLADIATTDDTATVTYSHGVAGNDLLDLKVQLSYTNTTVDKSNFHDGAFSCGPGNLAILCDSTYGYETFALKVENTADLSFGGWQNFLTTGVQFTEQTRTASSTSGNFAFHPEGKDSKVGVYAQGEFTLNERFVLIPGIRFDFGDRDPSAAVIAAGGDATNDTAMSASLAALYKFTETFSVFASYSTTERMPTLDELYTSSGTQAASFNLEKEKAETIELGFTVDKQNLISEGDVLQVKATAFHNDLEDLITRNTGAPAGTAYYTNIGKAAIWGAELEASYDAERWFASASWSSVKSQNRVTGAQLAETPAENVSLSLGMKLPEQNLTLGWRGYYFDEISTGAATTTGNALAGKSYDTHDLFVAWKPDEGALRGLEVNFAVENMFDKAYINNLALDNGVGRNYKISVAKSVTW
ncbi:TonB-dependent heme/hemoglobin receptor family protein [Cypionkella aquatica]|uniref:TonB-dependent heme/hemoglobin receptor family protein n=1 Tax=Cypionkella aquatica TaxID=1756042 RepID=A0AA37TUQ7_9RHOB|nr:TonB-dependent receptor [Cypionkella aquatica]GLS85883.1 TonB-dependent heme/hemoglobin receptor family protein [Cypionkella aquatica]